MSPGPSLGLILDPLKDLDPETWVQNIILPRKYVIRKHTKQLSKIQRKLQQKLSGPSDQNY